MTETRCALITIFNHKFERNIPRLEDYYRSRFAVRKYVVPFASRPGEDVIDVYGNGWSFGHHIAQAADRYIQPGIDYYVFAADDLLLNPRLDQSRLPDALGLDPATGYIKSLCLADAVRYAFFWSGHATFSLRFPGFDWQAELPSAEDAWAKAGRLGLKPVPAAPRNWRDVAWTVSQFRRHRFLFMVNLLMTGRRSPYPLLVGYSDFVVVPAAAVRDFARYCGVLSAANMQAEIVVPTALALACDKVRTELEIGQFFMDGTPAMPPLSARDRDVRARTGTGAAPKGMEIWGADIAPFERGLGNSFDRLVEEFPADRLYVHPIKLSRWT